MTKKELILSLELIKEKIYVIRGQKIMLDRDLAALYGVITGRLNEQVKRNTQRFPKDFMFRLDFEEFSGLISQFAISKKGGIRKMPYAFTEQGVAMLSSVLNSERAIQVNIQIMRTFVKMKEFALINEEVFKRLNRHDVKFLKHDKDFEKVFEAIQCLMELPVTLKRKTKKIGFKK